ncbi:MAG: YbjN domain-containing protein [Polyangiaceae bacterium]|nr:YbjN domain-containing protein [Myxococcales bacterium]MCB9589372.1 YbjN domain-containing protein [Polyangiaceae bacterium]
MSNEVLEGYLNKLERGFERSEDGTYLVSAGPHRPPIALRVAQPVLVAQVDVGPAPNNDAPTEAKLFRHLLELNASDLLHSSYALEDQRIVLTAALELANMDLNELEAILADMDLALTEHVPGLRSMVEGKES